MKTKMTWFLIIVLCFLMVGCFEKKIEEVEVAKLNTLSGANFRAYDYSDENWLKVLEEGIVYMNIEDFENSFELYVDYNKSEGIISTIRNDKQIIINLNNNTIAIDGKKYNGDKQIIFVGETPWIATNYFEDILGIEIQINKIEKTILIKDKLQDYSTAISNSKSKIVNLVDGEYEVVGNIRKGENVIVLSGDLTHYEVLTDKHIHGLITKENLGKPTIETSTMERFETSYSKEEKNVFLAWDQNYQKNPSEDVYGSIEYANVLSPIWLTYKDDKGSINSRVSPSYLKWANENGFDVWVTVTNDFDPKLTHEIISNSSVREIAINNLMKILLDNNIKGLNIDFENIYLEDKDYLVQFVAELTARCHKENILVSMDVTMMGGSDNWSRCYDRKRLGEIVDYLVIMAYDQHWASSPISGTVAGISWVEEGLEAILEIVPKKKIILGIPLYTRIWKETPSEKYVNTMNVKSKAITMAAAERIIVEKELVKIWDEINGQYFVSYIEDGILYKIWHEDFESLKLKSEVVKNYELAGAAVWRRGYEAAGTWKVIYDAMGE